MKKKILGLITLAAATLLLVGCGANKKNSDKSSETDITIGASPSPHAEILEHIKPELKKEGVNLTVKTFTDYVLPNKALAQGDITANYFQHIPYLEKEIKDKGYKFTIAGKIHLEPLGIYSKKVKKLTDLKEGATIITSNSQSDWGRILTIFKDAGLITLKEGVDETTATFDDIAKNPKNLKFKYEFDPALLTSLYDKGEGDAVAINSNFAVSKGLDPTKDAIALEKESSPYANVLVVQTKDKNNAAIKKVVKALKSKSTQDWILKKWKGAVIPVK